MTFASREDAGCRLGRRLRDEGASVDLVLGLPRGGVVVAAQVARELRRPLDVLIVRKIGHPWHREFAVGALAEPDIVILDDETLSQRTDARAELDAVIAEETQRLRNYAAKFCSVGAPDLTSKSVVLVDDGLATGATAEAAILAARARGVQRIVFAVPVASVSAVERLARLGCGITALLVDPDFKAVGEYYTQFDQTSDDQVRSLLQIGDG